MRELRLGSGLAILTVNIARVFVKKEVLFPKTSEAGSEEIEFEVKTSQGPVNNVEALLGAVGRRSRHVQVFCAKRRSCGGRHFPCSDRFPKKKVLPFRCVEDSHDPTEVSYRTLAQEARSGASGLLTTQIRRDRWCRSGGQGSERQLREGSSRKRGVRCLLSPLLCQRRRPCVQGCPTPSRIRPPGGSEESEGGRPSILGVVMRGEGLGLRTKECDFESVVGQVYSEEEAKRFIGKRWEATNLPLSWSKGAVQAFLAR